MKRLPPLWRCPRCGRRFVTRNLWHSCGTGSLRAHLRGKNPGVVKLFQRMVALARRNGPVRLAPAKTRIGLQVRMIFAAGYLKRDWLDAHLILSGRRRHPRITRVDGSIHYFRFRRPSDFDAAFRRLLREAYVVGRQEHLRTPR